MKMLIHAIRTGFATLACAVLATSCAAPTPAPPPEPIEPAAGRSAAPMDPPAAISTADEAELLRLMEKHKARTLGIGMIRDGQLVLTAHYGEQAPGIPASATTMFNTASVSKAITSELAIRLVDRGLIDLDEPISAHYIHPDIEDDPRHNQLTPRLILTHKTGFLNWPHEYEDGTLAFIRDPGDAYGYSGVGFDIFASFLEKKLGKPFPQIVRDELYQPLGLERISQHQEPWMVPHRVMPLDETGAFQSEFNFEMGHWNPADDLFVTVEAYARFLIAVMNNEGLSDDAIALRQTVQTDITNDPVWGCDVGGIDPCPSPYGHSLGWFVYGYGDRLNIQHGGNDMSEAATAYFKTDTRDGMVVFINAPNPEGIQMYVSVVDLLDDDQNYTAIFHYLFEKFFTSETTEDE